MSRTDLQIAEKIHSKYVSNQPSGYLLPTLRALEAEFSISLHTATAAMRQLTAQGVVTKATRGRGRYIVSTPQQKKQSLLGFVATMGMSYDLVFRIFSGIYPLAEAADLRVVLGESAGDYDRERAEVYRLRQLGCLGVVLFPMARTVQQLADDYLARELQDYPIVLIDMAYQQQKRSAVVFDNFQAGRDMARYFLNQGRRSFAFLGFDNVRGDNLLYRSLDERWSGLTTELQQVGLQAEKWLLPLRFDQGPAEAELRPLFDSVIQRWLRQRPEVIIAPEDKSACFLTLAAEAHGVKIPDDVVFAGFDNLPMSALCRPRFVSTAPDFVAAGHRAAELLLSTTAESPQFLQWHTLPVPLLPPVNS